jgi:hypothetical protein
MFVFRQKCSCFVLKFNWLKKNKKFGFDCVCLIRYCFVKRGRLVFSILIFF